MLADRKVRQQEDERHRANFAVQIEQLTAQVARLEEALRNTTRSYVIGRDSENGCKMKSKADNSGLGIWERASGVYQETLLNRVITFVGTSTATLAMCGAATASVEYVDKACALYIPHSAPLVAWVWS